MSNEKRKVHGHCSRTYRSPTYNAWANMKAKARKGIECDPSVRKFEGFLSFMGERPNQHALELIDETVGFRPGNMQWVKRWHGMSDTTEHYIWLNMIARCENPNDPAYDNYGGRGIKVHPTFKTFEGFISAIGRRPSRLHSVDRFPDNDGDYAPGNVHWATRDQQARNTRSNRSLTLGDRTQLLCEWADELEINALTISRRIDKYGWSVEEALTGKKFRTGIPKLTAEDAIAIYNASGTQAEIASRFGVNASHVGRIKSGHAWGALTQDGVTPREPSPKAHRSS